MSLLVILSAAVAPCALAGQGEGAAGGGGAADTISIAAPDEQARSAAAAVLVATLSERFDDPMLEVRLDEAVVESTGPRDQVVHGSGGLRFDGGDDDGWLAFRYRSRYDPLFGTAGYPEITLGGEGEAEGERFVPNDARLMAELEHLVAEEFESWPGAGRVFLQFDDISSLQSGNRFLQIEASGIVDFGTGGSTAARIEALYDLHERTWREIGHELAPNITTQHDATAAGY